MTMMMRRALALSRMLSTSGARAVRFPLPSPSFAPISPVRQVARNYATGQHVKEADIQVPIPMFGVEGNYASALYLAAVRANMLDKVESELKSIMESAKSSPAFQNFMKDLSVPRDVRVKAVQDIFGEAGFSDITKNFLAVAAEHGRLRQLEKIMDKFLSLTMAYRGEVNVVVTTVIPLPAQEEKELKEVLKNIVGAGKTVLLEQKINPRILGGLVIEFEDKLLDISIRTRLKRMENILYEPVDLQSI
uniref:TSA: Wollemia nobilis Ref_Wollemi_Transcript_19750_1066 transcribed RNA sequence n=1 Tax=Wollemia nobilis TaxID=56998 RepID=A0A0C9QN11_9CONI